MNSMIEVITSLWPLFLGFITLVVVLSRMHYSIESLTEKVKILFDFHNKKQNDTKSKRNN